MDATTILEAPPTLESDPVPTPVERPDPRSEESLLVALRRAIAEPGEHRLFRSGKLNGLFPSRSGSSADAARDAVTRGFLETLRTEVKGKFLTEWVRITPKGVAFVHDHDSPKVVLGELCEVLRTARGSVPTWLDDTRREIAGLSEKFEQQAAEILTRLDSLSERLEAALRRAETTTPRLPNGLRTLVPWATDALAYLDRRSGAGAGAACALGELFHAVREVHPELTVPDFHAGLQRLHDTRSLRLTATSGPTDTSADPEFALILGTEGCSFAVR